MVQSVDNNAMLPIYNAVKINISKPEINRGEFESSEENQGVNETDKSGIYNAVSIDIDNPRVNAQTKKIYDYPQAATPVPFDIAYTNPIALPQGFHVAYQTTNVIVPHVENEFEYEQDEIKEASEQEEIPVQDAENDKLQDIQAEVPAPNYTDTETEKSDNSINFDEFKVTNDIENENEKFNYKDDESPKHEPLTFKGDAQEEISDNVAFKAAQELKKPEIIPGTEIKPEVEIPLILSNLSNPDYDIQAQQMEEIARISLDNPANAVPYIVREVFANLIQITKNDTAKLAAPTAEQINARKKIIANILSLQNSQEQKKQPQLPFQLTENEINLANEISPMEQAERNKEYALYTMAILAKIYTDEVLKQTGNIVPMTDVPGVSAMVDSLRYSPNAGVKIAAIDSLVHISRPEYKDELNTIFALAQADNNPQVAHIAASAIQTINQNS